MTNPANTNLAYNFDMFAEHGQAVARKPAVSIHKTSFSKQGSIFAVTIAVVVAAMMPMFYLSGLATISELNSQITICEEQITAARIENARLSSVLDREVTFESIKTFAESSGMVKPSAAQEHFIEVKSDNLTKIAVKENGNKFDQIAGAVKKFWNNIS